MGKMLVYLSTIVLLASLVATSFWAPAERVKSAALECLALQKQAMGGGAELKRKANEFCKLADAQTLALHKSNN